MSRTIERSVEIQAPLTAVYNQATQFEDFPAILPEVQEVRQIDEKRVHWRAGIEGRDAAWEAAIVEQTPDLRIGWRCAGCPVEGGLATFSALGSGTLLEVAFALRPDITNETEIARWLERGLSRFKAFIEARGEPTGAWRGEIHGGQLEHPPAETAHRRQPAD